MILTFYSMYHPLESTTCNKGFKDLIFLPILRRIKQSYIYKHV